MVQRPWTCLEPISLAASTTPGHAFFRAAFSPSTAQGTAAPMLKPSAVSLISLKPVDRLDVDDQVGFDEAALHPHQQVAASGENGGRAV